MTTTNKAIIQAGNWGEDIAWELYEAADLPPQELCTAVMGLAVVGNKIVLACSKRGWGMLGGHIEDNETLEEALRREVLEEGGFHIDQFGLFAVRKITSQAKIPHQQTGKNYPFPTSYMTYYWATTKRDLEVPSGEEIIESGSFTIDELPSLNTPDQPIIEVGWRAFTVACRSK